MKVFEECVYNPIKAELTRALFELINSERDGQQIDRSLIKHCVDVYVRMGMSTVGVRRNAEPVEGCDRTVAYDHLPEVLPQADWLILCCPASPITRGIANAAVFAAMPAGAHFINVSRGEIAVEKDVVAALQSGHLAGAYLDVFEREPLDPASPLWDLPNVLVSPHTASHSQGQNEAIFDIFLDNLARFRAGTKLRNDVDDLG